MSNEDDFDADESEQYLPGDVVVLKSGGPDMTVKSVSGDPLMVDVVWFDGSERHDETFPAVTLELS